MKIKTFESLPEEHKQKVVNNIIAKAVPLFMDGVSTTLMHRKVNKATGYSLNLVERVLRTHEGFKAIVRERWDKKVKVRNSKVQNLEGSCQV
jgi:hypothetical protein